MADDIKLDEWGEPLGAKRECFLCGVAYYPKDSDAPNEYQTTYCSLHCYASDKETMEENMAADAAMRILDDCDTKNEDENYSTSKIGDFILKVRKEHKP